MNTKKFEINKTYSTRSICDHDCKWEFKIIKRTEKNIWFYDTMEKAVVRKKIHIYNNVESVYPLGHYSMCPVLKAA